MMIKLDILISFVRLQIISNTPGGWRTAASWWTNLKQHVCVLGAGSQGTDRAPVGVSLDGWRLLHDAFSSDKEHVYNI